MPTFILKGASSQPSQTEAEKEEERKTKKKDLEDQKSLTELRSRIKSKQSLENTAQEPGSPSNKGQIELTEFPTVNLPTTAKK